MATKISIVMCVYNRERYVGAAIESILNQTMRDFELIVWDDGSTDRSLIIAHHYAKLDHRVRVIVAEHQGFAPALKEAFATTSGAYIGSVDSDDLLAPTTLEETSAILDTHSDVGLVYTDYQMIDEYGQAREAREHRRVPYSKDLLLVTLMTFHFRLFRRCVYERVGGIDETFKRACDYDLCLRLSEVTNVRYLQRTLYYYRWHGENMTNQQTNCWGYKAIANALKRRSLYKYYRLELENVKQLILKHQETFKNTSLDN